MQTLLLSSLFVYLAVGATIGVFAWEEHKHEPGHSPLVLDLIIGALFGAAILIFLALFRRSVR